MPSGSVSGGNSSADNPAVCNTSIKTGNRTGFPESFEKTLWQRHWQPSPFPGAVFPCPVCSSFSLSQQ